MPCMPRDGRGAVKNSTPNGGECPTPTPITEAERLAFLVEWVLRDRKNEQ